MDRLKYAQDARRDIAYVDDAVVGEEANVGARSPEELRIAAEQFEARLTRDLGIKTVFDELSDVRGNPAVQRNNHTPAYQLAMSVANRVAQLAVARTSESGFAAAASR